MTIAWTDDMKTLWKSPTEFFPFGHADSNATLNATTRLLLYAGVAVGIIQRSFIPVLGAVILSVLLAMVYARRHRQEVMQIELQRRSCRGPTKDNPFSNVAVADFGSTAGKPCDMTDESMDKADAMLQTYVYSDTDDIFANDFATRPFLALPNGGTHPDFSGLADELAPTHS